MSPTVTIRRRRLVAFATVAAVLMVAAFALAGWSFWTGHQAGCQSRNSTLNVLRDVIASAQKQPSRRHLTKAERKRRHQFYVDVYARINKARCS